MAATKKVIDLDTELGLDFTDEVPIKVVKLLGREWRVLCSVNQFALGRLTSGDVGAWTGFIQGIIHADDRAAFTEALSTVPNLDVDKLIAIVSRLVEVIGERPTTPSSASSRTATRRTSARK